MLEVRKNWRPQGPIPESPFRPRLPVSRVIRPLRHSMARSHRHRAPKYTGSIGFAPGYQPYKFFFFYNGTQYYVTFSGLVTLTLGNSPTLSQSGDTYSYSYNHSVLDLNGDVKENDPGIDFYGDVVITTTAVVPEPSGLVAGLALLAVFAGSTWRERRAA